MTIRAVYFDLGGVILRTNNLAPRTALAESLGLSYDEIDRIVFGSTSSRQASTGVISEAQHWLHLMHRLNLPESDADRVMDAFFAGDDVDYTLIDFLRSLRPTYKTGLISNAWDGLRPWILREKFDDAFDHMTISAEVGVEKPDARIYRHALEKLNVRPEQAVFVDDVPANIDAAQALGLHGVLFKTTQQTLGALQEIFLRNQP